MRTVVAVAVALAVARPAHAAPNPKREVVVLEYRAGSSALPGIAARVVSILAKQTSLHLLGPNQTRAVYGEHLEEAIVRCGGQAPCIARIGARVGAAEVLLIGVSELGGVILTMQRIDVRHRAVEARIADSLAEGETPSAAKVNGYLARLMPPTDFLRFGVIDIVASEAGALVTVGGQRRGQTPIAPLKLHAPATYDVRVDKDGFVPFTTRVRLPPDGELKVTASLQRRTGQPSWWQHWYVLAAAGLIVAGAAGTTLYIVTRPSNTATLGGQVQ